MAFKRIKNCTSWSDIDELDGITLEDKEVIEIKWRDGTIEKHKIIVHTGLRDYSDHGHVYSMPVSNAFLELRYNGNKFEIPFPTSVSARRVKK